MDPSLLTSRAFWQESAPVAAGDFRARIPALPVLRSHLLFETSGSSGAPKWIALSKSALLASAAAVNRHLEVRQTSCWGLALPLHHVGGFGVAARSYEAGCRLACYGRRWDAPAFAAWLADNLVTHTSLVPTQVHDLARLGIQAPPSLRAVIVGGGHLDGETGRAARALGWPVLASYGMTEAASQIATQDFSALDHPYQPAPIPLLPLWRVKVTPDGRLCIAGPALFSGMLKHDGENWVFEPRSSEWYRTQDRVMLENDVLTPLGRADSLVKVLGELVDPAVIERELASLSGGALSPGDFAVVAVPDNRMEHALVPVFDAVLDRDAVAAALKAYEAAAPGFRRLLPPVWLQQFPRSPLGKPRRAEIAAIIAGGLSPR